MSVLIKGMEMPKHAVVNGEKDTAYKCVILAHPDNSAELVIDTEFASPYDKIYLDLDDSNLKFSHQKYL